MKRLLVLLLGVASAVPGTALAQSASPSSGSRDLCISVTGAEGEVTEESLLAGLLDGSIGIDAVRDCPTAASPTPDPSDQGGRWVTTSQGDPQAGEAMTVSALIMSDDSPAVGLVIACQSDTTVALIAWTEGLGPGPSAIETRAGDGPAQTATWSVADGRTAGLVGAVEFARSLLGETRLVARAPTP